MAIGLPPPAWSQPVLSGESYTQPWLDWFFRVQTTAGTLSTLTLPGELSISYVGDVGTVTWASAAQNTVFAGPAASAGTPSFRLLVQGDLPMDQIILASQIFGA